MRIVVVGAGISGLSAATNLANKGHEVTVIEKHAAPGGRARKFTEAGFSFDMGPSWYWMPDVFETYFNRLGKSPSDYYQLTRLDPSYRIFYGINDYLDVPAQIDKLTALIESIEPGKAGRFNKFMEEAAYKYAVGIKRLVYKPGRSFLEFLNLRLIYDLLRKDSFTSLSRHVRKYFTHPHIIRMLEFPVLFLGSTPGKTPALYSFMNYADLKLGTWYPMGGIYKVIEGMHKLAEEKGVKFRFAETVRAIETNAQRATGITTDKGSHPADVVVAGADYHHVEAQLLPAHLRSYNEKYWGSRILAPSALLFYLGIGKKLDNLMHHTLFFHEDFDLHASEIYENPKWPTRPLFYVNAPSKTDPAVAPEGCENLCILMPVAPGIEDDEYIRDRYFNLILEKLEIHTGQNIKRHIIYKRSYAHNDFIADYSSYKGNAYGLANTLMQTAVFKPSIKSKRVENLYFTGQLTVPGPGVPPSLISGIVVANEVEKDFRENNR